ncbi:uncharacterized protein LOC125070558 [Vanessa atalanta]|uniref:uncharacterized protein LOC125070558 n=1 Tax=Vanessa atalanta TaxID=42275 RepID=UPI001FCCC23B|nr:uncharacterized protein LOC125070558 [Vanessa atalanta]
MCTEPLHLMPQKKWRDLKSAALSDWPRSISMHTLLETEEHILELGIDYGFKVYSPYGDVNNGIVALNLKNKFYEVIIQCPKDDTTELEKALRTTTLIDWTQPLEVPFAPIHISECLKRIIYEKNCKIDHITMTQTFLLNKDSPLFDLSLAPEFSFKLLTLDYVNLVNTTWPHKTPGSEWYFELLIKANLGYGLFKGGELIAWSFIKEMGALGHLYTLENHRRKGYGELVLKLISNVLLKDNKCVYAFCIAGNNKAGNLYKKLGFASVLDVHWCNFVPN